MTLGRLRSWYNQADTMQTVLNGLAKQLDEIKAQRDLLDSGDNKKQLLAIESDLARGARDYERMQSVFLTKLNVSDMSRAEEKLVDFNIRLSAAEKLHRAWREIVSTYEFLAARGQISDGDGTGMEEGMDPMMEKVPRNELTAAIEEAKLNYETQLSIVGSMVPDKAVLI